MPFRPDVPRRDNQTKDRQVLPAQERAKSHPGFPIKDREQKKDRAGVNDPEQAFGETGERGTNPKSREPGTPVTSIPITA